MIESTRPAPTDFATWVGPHVAVMRRLAATLAPGFDPDDIVQETLLRAWQKQHTYQADRGTERSWLLALTRDRAQRTRTRGRARFVLIDVGSQTVDEPTAAVFVDLDLRAAIASLPTRQRQVVVLFYYVDLSVEETARVLDCATGTVKSTLADARARLGTMLGDNDD